MASTCKQHNNHCAVQTKYPSGWLFEALQKLLTWMSVCTDAMKQQLALVYKVLCDVRFGECICTCIRATQVVGLSTTTQ